MTVVTIFFLSLIQNISFTMVSRARNRDNIIYHIICSAFSNLLWFLTMHLLVVADLNLILLLPYLIGTVVGSVLGGKVSYYIEDKINAKF